MRYASFRNLSARMAKPNDEVSRKDQAGSPTRDVDHPEEPTRFAGG